MSAASAITMRAMTILALAAAFAAAWLVHASGNAATLSTPVRWTPAALSTDRYESSPTFSRDGRELYFFRADRQFGHYRLLQSHCREGRWSTPAEPTFAAPAGVLEADPALAPGDLRLYYVSAHGTQGDEDLDIWFVERRTTDSAWGEPRRLPAPINSPSPELLPRPLADG